MLIQGLFYSLSKEVLICDALRFEYIVENYYFPPERKNPFSFIFDFPRWLVWYSPDGSWFCTIHFIFLARRKSFFLLTVSPPLFPFYFFFPPLCIYPVRNLNEFSVFFVTYRSWGISKTREDFSFFSKGKIFVKIRLKPLAGSAKPKHFLFNRGV